MSSTKSANSDSMQNPDWECFFCRRATDNQSPVVNPGKKLQSICNRLSLDYDQRYIGKGPLHLCNSCAKTAGDIHELHVQIKALDGKLNVLVEKAKMAIFRSRQDVNRKEDVARGLRRRVAQKDHSRGDPKSLINMESSSCSSSSDDEDNNTNNATSKEWTPRAVQRRRTRLLPPLSSSDSDSDSNFSPEWPHYPVVCIEKDDGEVQIKEEPPDSPNLIDEMSPVSEIEDHFLGATITCPDLEVKGTENANTDRLGGNCSSPSSASSVSSEESNGENLPNMKLLSVRKKSAFWVPFLEEISEGHWAHGQFEFFQVEGGFKCDTCGAVLKREGSIKGHIQELHLGVVKGPEYICDQCGKVYTKKRSFTKHKSNAHIPKGSYPCKICGKPLNTLRAFNEHKWTHLSQEEIAHEISAGNGKPPKKWGNNKTPTQCRHCGKFVPKFTLSTHEKIHTAGSDRPFLCSKCPKAYRLAHELKAHRIRVHSSDPNRYQCRVCLKTFPTNAGLGKHMKEYHSENDKPFLCPVCGKKFRRPWYLAAHAVTHSEDRPWKCDSCSKTFRFQTGLGRHKREGCPATK